MGRQNRKTFTVSCSDRESHILGNAIRSYANAAYPPGGSDCAQVARETLLTSACEIEQRAATEGASISVRQRSMLRAAITWYGGETGYPETLVQELLRLLPHGQARSRP